MIAVKERLIGAVTIMTIEDAERLWEIVEKEFSGKTWDDIPEVVPDEWDLDMLAETEKNPDCHEFTNEKDIDWGAPFTAQ